MVSIFILLFDFYCDKDPAGQQKKKVYDPFIKLRKRYVREYAYPNIIIIITYEILWNELLL